MGQLYLKSAGRACGALGENIQDELAAVHHRAIQKSLEVSRLHWGQFPVGNHERRSMAAHINGSLLEFSCSPESLWIDLAEALTTHRHGAGTGTACQPLQFSELALIAVRV